VVVVVVVVEVVVTCVVATEVGLFVYKSARSPCTSKKLLKNGIALLSSNI
jgi:hypothetical protein